MYVCVFMYQRMYVYVFTYQLRECGTEHVVAAGIHEPHVGLLCINIHVYVYIYIYMYIYVFIYIYNIMHKCA